ncbi:MAG: rRNA adenine N-6-methyltransferase family protein [Pseudomonadota bacterium]
MTASTLGRHLHWLFLREWARRPLEVAAIAPSSTRLARLICAEISADTGPVLEIGPGTGVFTAQLLANGVAPHHLTLLEKNPVFAATLQAALPAVRVLNADAGAIQIRRLTGGRAFRAVVSGLGLLSMDHAVVERLMRQVFGSLVAGGAFYQFTYGLGCPVGPRICADLGLESRKLGRVLWNCPPAAVYRLTQTPRRAAATPLLPAPSQS